MPSYVYLVKYALTHGITKHEVSGDCNDSCLHDYHSIKFSGALNGRMLVRRTETYASLEDAIKAAKNMAKKRIANLKKQIEKLENLDTPTLTRNLKEK